MSVHINERKTMTSYIYIFFPLRPMPGYISEENICMYVISVYSLPTM